MNLTVIDTGEPGKPESMLTYYNKPSELNAEYARTNQKAGVPKDVLRSKFSQQPVKYNNAPVTYIDQGNVATGNVTTCGSSSVILRNLWVGDFGLLYAK